MSVSTISTMCIAFASAAIVFTVAYLFYASSGCKNEFNSSWKNTFPSELMETKLKKGVMILSILAGTSMLGAYMTFFGGIIGSSGPNNVNSATYFVLAISAIEVVMMILSSTLGFKYSLKLSISFCLLFILLTMGIGIFFPLILPRQTLTEDSVNFYHMNQVIAWIGFALFIVSALPLFNPELKNWYKMDKTEVDGKTIMIRPKINWLAADIWFTYVINILYMGLIIANSAIMY